MLVLSRRRSESIEVDHDILVKVSDIYGQQYQGKVDIEIAMPGQPINRLRGMIAGDVFTLAENITAKIIRVKADVGQVQIGIDAPKNISIWRTELLPIVERRITA